MPLAVNPLTPNMADFLAKYADASPDESIALAALLARRAIDKPVKLARLTLKDLGFGPDVPPGYIATMAEALDQARKFAVQWKLTDCFHSHARRGSGKIISLR